MPPAPAEEPTGFQVWVVLRDQEQVHFLFKALDAIPGLALRAAAIGGTADAVEILSGVEPAKGGVARVSLVPTTDAFEGDLIALGFDSEAVPIGGSGVGFVVPSLTFDDSATAVGSGGPGAPGLDPAVPRLEADEQQWKGIVARRIDVYLPPSVPLFGGRPIRGHFELGKGKGPQLAVESKIPADGDRPEIRARIECRDSAADPDACA